MSERYDTSAHAPLSAALATAETTGLTVLVLLIVALLLPVAASASPTVFVHPSELMVQPGETFSMSIRVDAGVDTVTCFLTEFAFDADVINLVEASEGSLFSMCGYGTMYHWDVVDSGIHSCNDVTLGYEAHTLPPGELVDLELTAGDEGGMTWIEITTVDLRDMQRNPILPVNTQRAAVFVVDATDVGETHEPHDGAQLRVHPNPCRGVASLSWALPTGAGGATLLIYDVRGRLVWHELLNGESGTAQWDGRGRDSACARAGVYFVELRSEVETAREKLIILR